MARPAPGRGRQRDKGTLRVSAHLRPGGRDARCWLREAAAAKATSRTRSASLAVFDSRHARRARRAQQQAIACPALARKPRAEPERVQRSPSHMSLRAVLSPRVTTPSRNPLFEAYTRTPNGASWTVSGATRCAPIAPRAITCALDPEPRRKELHLDDHGKTAGTRVSSTSSTRTCSRPNTCTT